MGAGRAKLKACHGTVGSSFSSRHRLVPCLSRLVSSRLVSSRLVSSRLVSAAALALALAACGDGADTTKVPSTTPTPPENTTPTLHSSLIGKTTAQQEALCEEDSTLLGCTGILAAKTARERKAAMDMLKLPFGGKISFTRTPVGGGSATTSMHGVEAIRQAGLEAKPMLEIKSDGTREAANTNRYSAGAIFLTSSTGTADTNPMLYGVHAGNVERRPGGLAGTEEQNRYNIVTKFTPTASGKYSSIEVFHVRKDKAAQTRLLHDVIGNNGHRSADLETKINTAVSDQGTVTSLAKLSSTGNNAYTEIGTLPLKAHLGLKADDMMFDKWSYKILSGKSKLLPSGKTEDGRFYAEVWDNYGVSKTDYMVGGVWLLMPEGGGGTDRTRFAAFAQTNSAYGKTVEDGIKFAVEGKATYNGLAAGFYLDDMDQVYRLLGKVTMNADFGGALEAGKLGGSIDGITLNGEGDKGALVLLPQAIQGSGNIISAPRANKDAIVAGSINGVAMTGDWSALFTGPASPADDAKPTGVIGTASGYSADEKHTFAVSFGAKPEAAKK